MISRSLSPSIRCRSSKLVECGGPWQWVQLATFAIAARALGISEFGYFSVMLAQIQLLITVATFQSNQAIVRYGVIHLGNDDRPAFQAQVSVKARNHWLLD